MDTTEIESQSLVGKRERQRNGAKDVEQPTNKKQCFYASGDGCALGETCVLWQDMRNGKGSVEGLYHLSEFHLNDRDVCVKKGDCQAYKRLDHGAW